MVRLLKSAINKRIIIGKIGAPHGVRGDVKVYPLTDFPDRFNNLKQVYINDNIYHIQYARPQDKYILMHFKNVDNREAIMKLTNQLLTVERTELMPLNPGEYYSFDIIGLSVFDTSDYKLGTITNILKTGSNDVYVVQMDDNQEILIPALKAVVCKIDLELGQMIIDRSRLEEF